MKMDKRFTAHVRTVLSVVVLVMTILVLLNRTQAEPDEWTKFKYTLVKHWTKVQEGSDPDKTHLFKVFEMVGEIDHNPRYVGYNRVPLFNMRRLVYEKLFDQRVSGFPRYELSDATPCLRTGRAPWGGCSAQELFKDLMDTL
jgi:hypothetical protein